MMTWEAQILFGSVNLRMLSFVFLSTLFTYFFHSLVNTIDPPASQRHSWNQRNRKFIFIMFLVFGLLTFITWWPFRHHPWPLIAAGAAAFLYTAPNLTFQPFYSLRRFAIGKTIYLALVWTYTTSLLPIMLAGVPVTNELIIFALSRFFLVYAICILFDRRDRVEDQAKGVRTLATLTHERNLSAIYFQSILLSITFSIWYGYDGHTLTGVFLIIPSLLLIFLYPRKDSEWGELFYFVLLDGLMMLSAVLHAIAIYIFSITFA